MLLCLVLVHFNFVYTNVYLITSTLVPDFELVLIEIRIPELKPKPRFSIRRPFSFNIFSWALEDWKAESKWEERRKVRERRHKLKWLVSPHVRVQKGARVKCQVPRAVPNIKYLTVAKQTSNPRTSSRSEAYVLYGYLFFSVNTMRQNQK